MVAQAKARLREKILSQRDSLTEEQRISMSKAIQQRLFSREQFQKAKTVAFYLHIGSEVNTHEMISEAMKLGKQVLVPYTNEKIEFCYFNSFDESEKGKYGILEPKEKKKFEGHPDVVIVPGAVFGRCMHRIGYGKGYYDRHFKNSSSYRIGICYDFQLLDKLPRHEHDEGMDEIITEKQDVVKQPGRNDG